MKTEQLNICFVLSHVPNPRMNKRIDFIKKYGKITVVCTRRSSQNIWEPEQIDVEHRIREIDLPPIKHILRRSLKLIEYKKFVLKNLKQIKPKVLYVGGLDSLLLAVKYKKKQDVTIIYEVADLREVFLEKNIYGNLLDLIVKKCAAAVDCLVVTSPKFYEVYYSRFFSKERVVVAHNIPDSEVFKNYQKSLHSDFTIGFIGGIRYIRQMKMLVDAAGVVGCKVLFAGAGGTSTDYDEIHKYCEGKEYVTFLGRYSYSKDIVSLYERVDAVYAVYDADNLNVRIALPNKLYEAIVCELPIVVAKNTYLSEIVNEWHVGISVDHKNGEELAEGLQKLCDDKAYYMSIVHSCRKAKKYLDPTKSQSELVNLLKNFKSN